MKAKTADEFYSVMGPLCAELSQMADTDCNNLIQVCPAAHSLPLRLG